MATGQTACSKAGKAVSAAMDGIENVLPPGTLTVGRVDAIERILRELYAAGADDMVLAAFGVLEEL